MAQKLINLQTSLYEHPFDREALKKVNAIPLLPRAVNFVLNWTYIKWNIVSLCGSNFHVTRSACEDLYNIARETWDTLELEHIPDLYMQQGYHINAYTTGHKQDAYIVVSTGAVDRLSEKELQFVIGHESGHIRSNHVLYHTLCNYFSYILEKMSVVGELARPLQVALQYWSRMSEFTADRAGLLACQDLDAALSAIMKLSGLPEKYYYKASVQGFLNQAKEFEIKYGGTTNTIIKTLEIFDEGHPWTIVRAAELIRWVESGQYHAILDGTLGDKCPGCEREIAKGTKICPYCGYKL